MKMCLKLSKAAKSSAIRGRLPCRFGISVSCLQISSKEHHRHLFRSKNAPQQETEQESIVLEVDVVHKKETGME